VVLDQKKRAVLVRANLGHVPLFGA
jgi:hypothetical protein